MCRERNASVKGVIREQRDHIQQRMGGGHFRRLILFMNKPDEDRAEHRV